MNEEYKESSNSNSDYVKADPEAVKSIIGNVNFDISTSSGTYSGETETYDYISTLFTNGIEKAKESWNSIKNVSNSYLDKLVIFPDPDSPMGTIIGGNANLREDANSKSKALQQVSTGQEVEIIENDGGNWIKVKLSDGTEGYVSKKFVNIDNDEEIL